MGRKNEKGGVDGLAVVNKAAGWTSHDVVAKTRKLLGQRRVGHAGTLDPSATGVLLLGVGRVTRLLRFLTALPKGYTGEVVLGTETTTLDADGDVVATHDMSGVTLDDMRTAAAKFVGEIDQIPPMVSAVKVGGRRLHELARAGEEVERAARRVTVHRLDVAPGPEPGVFTIDVECSSGTYVRTLAADIGTALGGGAHLRNLIRTRVGSFGLDDARELDALELLSPAEALRDYPSVSVDEGMAELIGNGRVFGPDELAVEGPGPWAVVDQAGRLLAVYERHGARFKPAVVVGDYRDG